MATVASTLYPPQVETFMPAFVYTDAVKIYFSISTFNSKTDIKKVHISVVDQKTNINALNDSLGILFRDFSNLSQDEETGLYYVKIDPTDLKKQSGSATQEWNINQFYKVQLRFDQTPIASTDKKLSKDYNEDSELKATYLNTNSGEFSEWSSVCLVRPIAIPDITLTSMEQNSTGEDAPAYNKGFVPIAGQLTFSMRKDDSNTSFITYETEKLQSYYITVSESKSKDILWTSETFYTADNVDPNSFQCKIDLNNINEVDSSASEQGGGAYCLNVHYTTTDEYTGTSSDYRFDIAEYLVGDWNPTAWFEVDNEEGKVKLHVENVTTSVCNAVIITRTSSISDCKDWETVAAFKLTNVSDTTIFEYEDKTVGSHIWYRYKLQGRNKYGVYTSATNFLERYTQNNYYAFPTFYDAMLYRNDQQLDIRYDFKISNYKQTVNRTKFDTLGGKYPKFAENAAMKYKQFSISGLISSEADANQVFLNKEKYFKDNGEFKYGYALYNEYLNDEGISSIQRNDFLPNGTNPDTLDNNAVALGKDTYSAKTTTWRDYFWEREFREQALNWLNDGEPKLFRSMTEGLMAVMLMDISLTPNANLGRMVYSFSATAYEIADGHSLETLDSLGIINIPGVGDDDIDADSGEDRNYYPRQRVGQLYKPDVDSSSTDLITNIIANELKTYYQGVRGSYLPIITGGLIYLKDLKIQFTTSTRALMEQDSSSGNVPFITYDPTQKKSGNLNPLIGYQLKISSAIPDDNFDYDHLTTDNYILVNHRGYYQVPTDANTYHLALPNAADEIDNKGKVTSAGDEAIFDYILNYNVTGAEQEVTKISVVKTIVGQYSDIFAVNESYGSVFRAKYSFVHQTSNNLKAWYRYMPYFKGICFDLNPYSVVAVKYYGEDDYHTYMIGETGILHLLDDTPIQDVKFLGRKFVKKENKNSLWYIGNTMRKSQEEPMLREYEYYFDDSVDPEWLYGKTKEKKWHEITTSGDLETKDYVDVYIVSQKEDETLHASGSEENTQITNLWHRITTEDEPTVTTGYTAFEDINNPKVNYVYRINNEYYIYYIDHEWYKVSMVGYESGDSPATKQTIIAEIPAQGHVDFKGTILKVTYSQDAVLDKVAS